MYSGGATGTHTPRSSQNLRPLILSHGSLEYAFLIPTALHFPASQLKEAFNASLPEPTDELAQDDEPSSNAELVARYIGFIASEVDDDDEATSFAEVLKVALTEFERAFMHANDVHALAASLPGITAKKLKVVESYYAGRAAVARPIKPHDSALMRAADDEDASIYTVFGGQGNIEEYFDELREVYTISSVITNPPFSSLIIRRMSCCGGTCGCGPNCKCGTGCNGCGMYPDLSYSEAATVATPAQVLGFQNKHVGVSEMVASENGCKCGGNCNCSTCSNCN